LLASVIGLGVSSRATAQTPSLDAFYNRLDPKTTFKYKLNGEEKVCNVGAFQWEIPQTDYGTGGLDRNFTGYCAEIDVPILASRMYRFRQQNLLDPAAFHLESTPEGIRAAERRVTLIRELFGRYYSESKTAEPTDTFAFQVALWELTEEAEPAERAATFNVFAGTFQANYPPDQAPAFVTKAQSYLDSLTGNDAVYYTNQSINGRELIRLLGIPNANGVVAQSQYALRYINGGAPGVGALGGLGNSGGGFGFGGGGGGGGFGGFGNGVGGGGPALFSGSGGGGGGGSSSTPGGPSSTPPTPGGGRVPGGGPQGTPVPAPAGLVLGLVAVGAIASRRVYHRLAQR
jgi:hypothetical protein